MNIDEITFPQARRTLTRDVIVAALDAEVTGRARPRRLRTPAVVAIVVGALAVPAGATAYYAFREVENTSTVRCFTEASLDGEATYLESTDGADGRPVEIADPVGACADLWSIGVLRAGLHDAQPPTPGADLPVPELTACVIDYVDDREVVAVIPGDDTVCKRLGLPRWAD